MKIKTNDMIKPKLYTLFITIAAISVIASCKKADIATAKKIDQAAIATQLAKNITNSLVGDGSDVSKGVAGSASNLKVTGDSRCGTQIDSAINRTYTNVGVTTVVTGHFNFKYLCESSNSNTIGYILTDSTRSYATSSESDFLSIVKQNYTVIGQSIDGLLTNGTQESHFTQTSKAASIKSYHQDNKFVLKNVLPIPFLGTIKSGSADFVIDGNEEGASYHYKGTIVFKSAYIVLVEFGNATYEVNMLTGVTKLT